jgi:hypothetical protein
MPARPHKVQQIGASQATLRQSRGHDQPEQQRGGSHSAVPPGPPAKRKSASEAAPMLALASKRGFLAGEGPEPGLEVGDVFGLGRDAEDLVDGGQEVVEGSHGRRRRA